jgi:hypothetical protein
MSERRYSEEEVGAIFELATKAQAGGKRALPSGEGLTLSGLQEIGREVGIPPELVAQAARELDTGGRETSRSLIGLPIGVGNSVDLGRKLTDGEWEQLVSDARETFDARGRIHIDGPFRQWVNSRLQILVEPTPSGHRVRFKTYNSTAAGLIGGGLAMLGVSAFLAMSLAATGRLGQPKPLSGLLFVVAMSAAMAAWGALRLPGWARNRRQQFKELAERLMLPPGK